MNHNWQIQQQNSNNSGRQTSNNQQWADVIEAQHDTQALIWNSDSKGSQTNKRKLIRDSSTHHCNEVLKKEWHFENNIMTNNLLLIVK